MRTISRTDFEKIRLQNRRAGGKTSAMEEVFKSLTQERAAFVPLDGTPPETVRARVFSYANRRNIGIVTTVADDGVYVALK